MKNITSCTLLLLAGFFAFAQDKPAPTFSVRGGVLGTTTTVYQVSGTDTAYVNNLVVAPLISLVHSKGFSLDYVPYFLTGGKGSGIYMHTIALGYENYDGKNFTVRTGYTHYFFTNNTSVPSSPISNEVYFATDYKKAWLQPALSLGLGFGQDDNNQVVADLNAGFGVKHGFDFENSGVFSSIDVSPSLFVNAGTNNYYSFLTTSKYLSRNKNLAKAVSKGKSNGRGNSSGGTTTSTNTKQGFLFNNAELGLYSDFTIQQFHIKPQGSIYIPVRSGDNSLSGYWQINLEYYF